MPLLSLRVLRGFPCLFRAFRGYGRSKTRGKKPHQPPTTPSAEAAATPPRAGGEPVVPTPSHAKMCVGQWDMGQAAVQDRGSWISDQLNPYKWSIYPCPFALSAVPKGVTLCLTGAKKEEEWSQKEQ